LSSAASAVGSGRRLDAVASRVLEQVRVRLLEVDERAGRPVGEIFETLALPEPLARARTWREPSNEGAGVGEGRDAGGTLRCQAEKRAIAEQGA
jgi:hypothetical protein